MCHFCLVFKQRINCHVYEITSSPLDCRLLAARSARSVSCKSFIELSMGASCGCHFFLTWWYSFHKFTECQRFVFRSSNNVSWVWTCRSGLGCHLETDSNNTPVGLPHRSGKRLIGTVRQWLMLAGTVGSTVSTGNQWLILCRKHSVMATVFQWSSLDSFTLYYSVFTGFRQNECDLWFFPNFLRLPLLILSVSFQGNWWLIGTRDLDVHIWKKLKHANILDFDSRLLILIHNLLVGFNNTEAVNKWSLVWTRLIAWLYLPYTERKSKWIVFVDYF